MKRCRVPYGHQNFSQIVVPTDGDEGSLLRGFNRVWLTQTLTAGHPTVASDLNQT